jgi:glycosyltransferase involved in cell wall biosynthesis
VRVDIDASDSDSANSITAEAGVKDGVPTILQVLPRLESGGVERGTVDVTAAIVEAGWRAVVASGGGQMVREVERAGGLHVTLPVFSKSPIAMRANVKRLEKLIREQDVDIVHARSRAPAWSARAAARHTGAHFITTFHGAYNESNAIKRRYNSIMAKGERVIAISEFIADRVVSTYGADPHHVCIIPRGVDLDIFHPSAVSAERMIQLSTEWRLPDAAPVIMLPGRLTRWKGHEVLIEALARMGRNDVRCIMVGADQGHDRYRKDIDDHIARTGVGRFVQIVGECRDMPAAYMLADVVVSASTDPEAFGRVAAEAQAMGRPVVATDHGGARETVVPGETGWLVTPGDPDALASAIGEALAMNTEQRESMARSAIGHVNLNFSRAQMCASTLQVYAEVLEGDTAGGV